MRVCNMIVITPLEFLRYAPETKLLVSMLRDIGKRSKPTKGISTNADHCVCGRTP